MPPVSKGRKPTYSSLSLKQEWKDYKAQNPKGTKTEFAKIVGLSYSRIKAILNDHKSEQRRKEKKSIQDEDFGNQTVEVTKKKKYSGLMFEPF